ncbi:endoplasmic reticulum metallopeptidase 1 [Neltuma alba]|uniref:endoplasmic reticulum metallopeptidase 1 n=1 Tax=Neltuma alba TaxID=207710 RepID=UPI0010A4E120|nr:endoplasmic reticulum metallopeptidase 1 [Prosopis alba]XP_028773607.1 endoplasmic reticulum metallopeptidase 1 [Prosopis alba]
MQRRHKTPSTAFQTATSNEGSSTSTDDEDSQINFHLGNPRRSSYMWLTLFVVITYCCSAIYRYQFENMPVPLTAEQAGKRGFSEIEALKHVKALTELGPHPVASEALDSALQYVLAVCQTIKKTAHWEVDVEVDFFHAKSGANRLDSGLFMGRTLVYSDLKHVVVRISPKYVSEAREQSILVSSHIDTVFSTEGAGDCSSCIAVMMELARGISQWAHGLKKAIIFLFNTGEEEGLSGAHSFITQHPWSKTVHMAIDLEAMGIGGKSGIFQAGPHPWAIERFASVAKYPSGQTIAQDLFSSGAIKSATDFQVYKEVAGLSGLDFAYVDNTAVYHTKNDKLALLKKGSLQHLGENMLAFLLHIAASPQFPRSNTTEAEEEISQNNAIYFDILGTYMVVYHQKFANILHNSVIMQSLLIWTTSLLMGGFPAVASLALSCLSVLLMWVFGLGFSFLAAFFLSLISWSPVPYVSTPWLVVGLFAAPAFLGSLTGQHLGYLLVQKYLLGAQSRRKQLSRAIQVEIVKVEAERWLYKAGSFQWLILLILGSYYKIGSSYLALVWLISPAFAYGFFEATLTPARLPKPLKLATLLLGLAAPVLISAGTFIRLAGIVIGSMVRLDRNPGGTPEWLGNFVIAGFIAALLSLTLVYLLAYVHISGAKRPIILGSMMLFSVSLALVLSGAVPPFTEDTARAVNVVHVVDATGNFAEGKQNISYVSLFSTTPGKLMKEVEQIQEGFVCGRDKQVDFVTFSVKYGCWTYNDTEGGWSESEIPKLHVDSDAKGDQRATRVSIDTKGSVRWVLAINTEEIEDFKFTDTENSEELIRAGKKGGVDGWHIIQFSGGKNSPTLFDLDLHWRRTCSTQTSKDVFDGVRKEQRPLLKLRTDVDKTTDITERILMKLPRWCSLFGKSTSPRTFAFFRDLPVNF